MKFLLIDESLNAQGSRILVSGLDISQFKRNPVMLYMHNRNLYNPKGNEVIGRWEQIEKSGNKIQAEAVFDMDDDHAARIAKKVEKEFIKMASIGIRIIEVSEDKKLLLPGQTRPTITKSELIEASIVDIGANNNALRLYDANNRLLELSATLPNINFTKNTINMNEQLLQLMGLSNDASQADIENAVKTMKAKADAAEKLMQQAGTEYNGETAQQIEALVNRAIMEKRIKANQKDAYTKLAIADYETTKKVLNAMPFIPQLSEALNRTGSNYSFRENWTIEDYLDKDPEALETLMEDDPAKFNALNNIYFGHQ